MAKGISLRVRAWPLYFVAAMLAFQDALLANPTVSATASAASPAWARCSAIVSSSLSATAQGAPTSTEGCGTFAGPTWKWEIMWTEWSNDGINWTLAGGANFVWIQDFEAASTNFRGEFYVGKYWRVTCRVTAAYTDNCTTNKYDAEDVVIYPKTAEVDSLEVTSGAIKASATDNDNWGYPKATGSVFLKATIKPNHPDAISLIRWTGADPVTVDNSQATVPRTTVGKTIVTANCGDVGITKFVWILLAEIEIKTSGTTPTASAQFGTIHDGTENLGAVYYDGTTKAAGKICAIATISPAGAGAVFATNWKFKRQRWCHDFVDWTPSTVYYESEWTTDNSSSIFTRLTPNADKIYDIDGPNCGQFSGATMVYHTFSNFRQFVEWNDILASEYAPWHWQARWDKFGSPNQITSKNVGTENITLPSIAPP